MSVRRLKPYPAYKDSAVEWLGEIPAHWEVKRVKHAAAKVGSGKTPPGGAEVYVSDGVMLLRSQNVHFGGLRLDDVAFIGSATDAEMAGTRVRDGDVLLNITGASLGRCCVARLAGQSANVNQHVCIIRPRPNLWEPAFLGASLASRTGQAQIFTTENGISRDALNFEQIGNFGFARPPLAEQRAIAAFLDREAARIEALVAKKERLIELLQEKRSALITRAVTKGLDPNVPMKDSGVEWLGEIPVHWEASKMWRISSAISGGTPAKEEPRYWGGGIPWVSPKDMKRRFIDSSEDTITDQALAETGLKLVSPPAVLIVVRGMILAHSFPVAVTTVPVTINQDMKALRLWRDIEPSFIAWVFEGVGKGLVAAVVEEAAHGTRAIRMDQWRSVTVPVPPESEQRAIAASLDQGTARIDALVAKVHEAIERLKELRVALISAAVTGKVDVRQEAAMPQAGRRDTSGETRFRTPGDAHPPA